VEEAISEPFVGRELKLPRIFSKVVAIGMKTIK
jgi:hypothetical protein